MWKLKFFSRELKFLKYNTYGLWKHFVTIMSFWVLLGKSLHSISFASITIVHNTSKHDIKMLELTPEQASIARGLRAILEDNLYFVLVAENCIHGDMVSI